METLSHSILTFLLNALWQIPVVAAVAALVGWLMRDRLAGYRHAIYVAALLAALGLPLASIQSPAQATDSNTLTAPMLALPAASIGSHSPATSTPTQPEHPRKSVSFAALTAGAVLAAYLLFLAFRISLLAAAIFQTIQIRRSASPVAKSDVLLTVWNQTTQAFRAGAVQLLSSPKVESPVMVGLWSRAIILPTPLLAETSAEVLTTAIGHEMAHIARHDFAANLLYEILYLPIAFHPAAWLLRREIDRTRELACDELVTARLIKPGAYAKAIVSIAAGMTALRRPGYTLGVFDGDNLEQRIRRLLDRAAGNRKRSPWLLATGLTALAACAFLVSGLAINASAQSAAQPDIRLGADAFNAGDIRGAVELWKRATDRDPANLNAKLFLASAYLQPPVSDTSAALALFEEVLARDPHNKSAIFGVASLLPLDRWQQAHDLIKQVTAEDPKNKNAYYMLGVLDWRIAYPPIKAAMTQPAYMIADSAARKTLRDQNLAHIQEGYQALETALKLDPNAFDTLAYMNLLLRLDAALVDNPTDAQSLMAKADACVQKALELKRKEQETTPGAALLDPDAPPTLLALPPPPPPPPPPAQP
jgi:beta-lactamase regulating signal transducer with metallopeptidase domain